MNESNKPQGLFIRNFQATGQEDKRSITLLFGVIFSLSRWGGRIKCLDFSFLSIGNVPLSQII